MGRKNVVDPLQPFYRRDALVVIQPVVLETITKKTNGSLTGSLVPHRERIFQSVRPDHIHNPLRRTWAKHHDLHLFKKLGVSTAHHWSHGHRDDQGSKVHLLQWKEVCLTFLELDQDKRYLAPYLEAMDAREVHNEASTLLADLVALHESGVFPNDPAATIEDRQVAIHNLLLPRRRADDIQRRQQHQGAPPPLEEERDVDRRDDDIIQEAQRDPVERQEQDDDGPLPFADRAPVPRDIVPLGGNQDERQEQDENGPVPFGDDNPVQVPQDVLPLGGNQDERQEQNDDGPVPFEDDVPLDGNGDNEPVVPLVGNGDTATIGDRAPVETSLFVSYRIYYHTNILSCTGEGRREAQAKIENEQTNKGRHDGTCTVTVGQKKHSDFGQFSGEKWFVIIASLLHIKQRNLLPYFLAFRPTHVIYSLEELHSVLGRLHKALRFILADTRRDSSKPHESEDDNDDGGLFFVVDVDGNFDVDSTPQDDKPKEPRDDDSIPNDDQPHDETTNPQSVVQGSIICHPRRPPSSLFQALSPSYKDPLKSEGTEMCCLIQKKHPLLSEGTHFGKTSFEELLAPSAGHLHQGQLLYSDDDWGKTQYHVEPNVGPFGIDPWEECDRGWLVQQKKRIHQEKAHLLMPLVLTVAASIGYTLFLAVQQDPTTSVSITVPIFTEYCEPPPSIPVCTSTDMILFGDHEKAPETFSPAEGPKFTAPAPWSLTITPTKPPSWVPPTASPPLANASFNANIFVLAVALLVILVLTLFVLTGYRFNRLAKAHKTLVKENLASSKKIRALARLNHTLLGETKAKAKSVEALKTAHRNLVKEKAELQAASKSEAAALKKEIVELKAASLADRALILKLMSSQATLQEALTNSQAALMEEGRAPPPVERI